MFGSPRSQLAASDGHIYLQWCTGAPGIVAGAWGYLDEELLLGGAELVWQAGAHRDEKGHGICHGTSGQKQPTTCGDNMLVHRRQLRSA